MFFKFDERIYCYILYRFSFFWLFLFPGIFCSQVQAEFRVLPDQSGKNTVHTRFQPPEDYVWQKEIPGSFGDFLEQLPLLPDGAPVRDFRGNPVGKQHLHAAVIRLDTGDRDLQQCADAWIRLYAEYLWQNKRFDDIAFRFTSGQKMSWNDFRKGMRTIERGDSVTFCASGKCGWQLWQFPKISRPCFSVCRQHFSRPRVGSGNIRPRDKGGRFSYCTGKSGACGDDCRGSTQFIRA